ncbi:putative ATP-dependent RNA helicase SoYb [Drosophila innubila]|uniref:putative ATP-dependent RNA helicase SoYb n=1 Tax=Drosophila innubila TaxID=198719 RepID=UPI00148D772B|nr:putative ATP-dependent RNA helicase SoYb [Drosophila innubila]
MEEQINNEVSSYKYDGVKYDYVTPKSKEFSYDFVAKNIKTKDFNNYSIAVVCEHADEAENIMKQLGKRSVACLLLNRPNHMLHMIVNLWTKGLLNAVLVLSDDMLSPLAECEAVNVDLLIHSTEPLPHVFQKRIQTLIRKTTERETHVIVIRSSAAKETKIKETTSPPATVPVIERCTTSTQKTAVNGTQMTPSTKSPSLTDNSTSSEDSIVSVTSKSESPDQMKTDTKRVYTYTDFGVYAQSVHRQETCFNVSQVTTLHSDIIKAMMSLNIGEKRAKSVQRFAWPHVAQGRSLCVVGQQQSGKTWCYLPWLCHRFTEEALQRDNNTNDFGPSCIILCASGAKGKEIARWCVSLTSKSPGNMDRVVTLFERSDVNAVTGQLVRHPCGILLTTVELMLQLSDLNGKDTPIFNPSAIRCVAIDDLCHMWRCRRMDCDKLIEWLFSYLRIGKDYTQLMIVSRLWSNGIMQRLLPKMPDVLLVLEDALEATIYGGVKLDILTTDAERCEQDIIKLLKAMKLNEERVVLACHTKKEADQLGLLLLAASIKSIIIFDTHGMLLYEQWCQRHRSKVLIVTDEAVPKLRGDRVDRLVHYTPARNWSRFRTRFSLFYGNYKAPTNLKKATSTVFLGTGERDLEQMWHICDFMLKHDRVVPGNWITWLSLNCNLSESCRNQQSFCQQLSVYGECWRLSCRYRHHLWHDEIMQPIAFPKNYEIQFHIISIVSPSQLVVKLTKFEIKSYYMGLIPITELGKKIQEHYQESSNRRNHLNPKPGDVCIVKFNNQYQRIVVIQVDSNIIKVKQVDSGRDTAEVKSCDLWVCDESFTKHSFEATELRITGLMPLNMDRIWPEDAKNLVRKHFSRLHVKKPLRVYRAEVDFDFNDVRFVKNVYDDAGNDMKSLVVNNMPVHIDDNVMMRLQDLFEDTLKPISNSKC